MGILLGCAIRLQSNRRASIRAPFGARRAARLLRGCHAGVAPAQQRIGGGAREGPAGDSIPGMRLALR